VAAVAAVVHTPQVVRLQAAAVMELVEETVILQQPTLAAVVVEQVGKKDKTVLAATAARV
jgi:hypothetical protein